MPFAIELDCFHPGIVRRPTLCGMSPIRVGHFLPGKGKAQRRCESRSKRAGQRRDHTIRKQCIARAALLPPSRWRYSASLALAVVQVIAPGVLFDWNGRADRIAYKVASVCS